MPGTPFSDGRLDLAFRDLAVEREHVLRLQKDLAAKECLLATEQAKTQQAAAHV